MTTYSYLMNTAANVLFLYHVRMDEETLEALLAGSDDEITEADENDDAGSDLEDLEGPYNHQYIQYVDGNLSADSVTLHYMITGEEERHKVSLQALKEKDPEFYKYLEENDPALLGFGDDGDEGAPGQYEDDENDDDEATAKSKKSKKGKERQKAIVVKKELLAQWQTQMLKVRTTQVLSVFTPAFFSFKLIFAPWNR